LATASADPPAGYGYTILRVCSCAPAGPGHRAKRARPVKAARRDPGRMASPQSVCAVAATNPPHSRGTNRAANRSARIALAPRDTCSAMVQYIAVAAVERVAVVADRENVIAAAAKQRIDARSADQRVVTIIFVQKIAPGVARNHVV